MNRRNILSLSGIMAFGLALLPGSTVAQQKTLKEQLVGSWTLVSNENTFSDGKKQQIYGANPKGILILDAGGRYATETANSDRPKLKSGNRLEITPAEIGAAALGFAANFGTWSVDEAGKALIRKLEVALIPNNAGRESKVAVSLAGDELKLTDANSIAGGTNVTVYRRAK